MRVPRDNTDRSAPADGQLVRGEIQTGKELGAVGRQRQTRAMRGGAERARRTDGFSMRVLARSGRTKREMNFGKREMAVRLDVQAELG